MELFTTATIELLTALSRIFGSYGVGIIVLTIAVRLMLWPLSVSQQRSMKVMQKMQPKLRIIQERYKSNPQMMQQKMMSSVPEADVVVVNPTHYAVALVYDPLKTPVPKVVAKGVDFVAFKIREIAKNNGVPIVENKPLARSLYKLVDINGIIPQELYVAVAEILQYVYSLKNK